MRNKARRIKIDSSTVQGEGSFVLVKPPSWGLLRKAQRMSGDGVDAGAAGVAFAEELVAESVVEWNWTDDDDQPLPAPNDDRGVIDRLTSEEVAFLVERITAQVSAPGN